MQDNNLLVVVLATCGLGLVCLTVAGAVVLWLLRVARGPIFSFFSLLSNHNGNDSDEDDRVTSRTRSPSPDLRSLAAQHDFDSALAAQQARTNPQAGPGSIIQGSRAQSPFGTDAHRRVDLPTTAGDETPPLLRSNRRRRTDNRPDQEDEFVGGMLDLDGDGNQDL